MLDIRGQTYACDLDLYPISSCQLFGFSPTSLRAMRLRLPTFIFYFLRGNAGGVILALPMKAIGLAAMMLEVVLSHCLVSWSHFETWWGAWFEKNLILDIISALVETDGLDIWLPQKQPGLGPLVAFSEKITLSCTTYDSKRLRRTEAETKDH